MHNKLRIVMAATALLYLGPLLAGLGGYGWSMVPAFTLLFVLWLIVMRPQLWPRELSAWTRPEVIVAALAQVMVQVLLIVICFGIGRGIGGVAGVLPMLSPLFPLAVSLLSIPLTRMVYNPEKMAQMDSFLDDALRRIQEVSVEPAPISPEIQADVDAAIAPVLALADDAPDDQAQAAVSAAMRQGVGLPVSMGQHLIAALDPVVPPRMAARRGLVLWGTEPQSLVDHPDEQPLRAGFAVTWLHPDLLSLYVDRALPLIEGDPGLWECFPELHEIWLGVDDSNPPDLNERLSRLGGLLEAAMPPELRPHREDIAAGTAV